MELSSIRTHVLEQMDWTPEQSTDFKAKVNRFVNRAYQFIYEDAPFLLQTQIQLHTVKDTFAASTVSGDRVEVDPTDPYVMRRAAGVTGASPWATNGTWDGRWVEITDGNGNLQRIQTREWWASNAYDMFSLVKPFQGAAGTAYTYRVYTPTYYLPGDVVAIKNCQLYHNANYRLIVATQGELESGRLVDYNGRTTGIPRVVFMGTPFALDAPTRAPSVQLVQLPPWDGPDNAGEFDYCYTYCWGRRDVWNVTSQNLVEPVWESAPSPWSERITSTNGGDCIQVYNIPDIDKQLNFGSTTPSRSGRSGIYIRVYARRYSADETGGILDPIESQQVPMLLAEIEGDDTEYLHTGADFLDYMRRLKPTHNHTGVRFYPQPDNRYELDLRVQTRPVALTNDQDAPRIPEDAIELLIQRVLVLMYEYNNQPEMSQLAMARYKEMLGMVTKRYSTINYMKVTKRLARINSGVTGLRARAVTYTEPT